MRATEKTQAVAAKEQRIRALESELRALKAAESEALTVAGDGDEEEAAGDVVELRMLQPQKESPMQEELCGATPTANMDPFACLCWCKFKRIGQSYVLHESRAIKNGEVHKSMVIVGPHWIGVVVTLAIILVATIAFLYQQCSRLAWYYTLFTFAFCFMTLYYLFETSCRDPGILLPHRYTKDDTEDDQDNDDQMENGQVYTNHEAPSDLLLSQRFSSAADTALVTPSRLPTAPGAAYANDGGRTRMCDICGVQQDQYTEHCDDCDVCIDEYDHHCPWMGKCIGRKNLRAFKLFNLSWVLYVVFVLGVAIQNVEWADMAIQRLERTANGSWMPVPPRSHQP